ncbi:glycosyltransferase family 4 protein [Suillus clintonianus]|uniref:glycosyltransferase family 4 protein n=1 Tax=Suillus clintonianus TaxID=1904413 RepID=UPI001B862B6B|nr:glycosyltransferase family 4 protein [Suillus clintonianus]KAG2126838.1 glycosyltransferase family 4 protein [Suillus clintonianus]
MAKSSKLRIAFIHPDLGIGGAERLVVDAALGLQSLGHSVDIYTSHHDSNHCFDETRDGRLRIHHVIPPLPRSIQGKFHILFAHARQLHLTMHLMRTSAQQYDVFFVDQLSTCIPFLRMFCRKRVVFYCHFPDKLLANGAYVEGRQGKNVSLLKSIYRFPMDWLEEATTTQADLILANSKFTARVTKSHFSSLRHQLKVVYPGINIAAYISPIDPSDPDILQVASQRRTLLSLNRFEMKKNAALAIEAFAILRNKDRNTLDVRLVLAGGYDPRLEDNIRTLESLIELARFSGLTYNIITPLQSRVAVPSFPNITLNEPDILFLLNFTTAQRSGLLQAQSTVALLYTPANEHFGIGPVEGMICGLPILACDSGGPTESIVDQPTDQRTGWLYRPQSSVWAQALEEICNLSETDRKALSQRARDRAQNMFGMDAMAKSLEEVLEEAVSMGPVSRTGMWLVMFAALGLVVALIVRYGSFSG